MRGLAAYERGICDCGFHESLTGDKANHFTFGTRTCPVCAGWDRYKRILGAQDEKMRAPLGENPPANRVDPADGRRDFPRLQTPAEVEAEAAKRRQG
jgi:hypothetical protein